jgi:thiol:disulfide interchange protein
LAAFVATPCAGPFLGVALGTALLLPAVEALVVFAALGLGLALPFVVVAFIPAQRSRLPKPGRWMARLQRILAIPMALTAAACLWLLWRQGGLLAFDLGIAAVLGLTLLLFSLGRGQAKGEHGRWAIPAALALAVVAVWAIPSGAPTASSRSNAWSTEAVARAQANGHPVFVYFTADWCLTCKVNETGAIDRDSVRAAFRKAGVVELVGDWTNGDPAITRLIESRGRAGVPLYLWYEPGKAEPKELPQVLTPSMLSELAASPR